MLSLSVISAIQDITKRPTVQGISKWYLGSEIQDVLKELDSLEVHEVLCAASCTDSSPKAGRTCGRARLSRVLRTAKQGMTARLP